jgi:hypothetical protein
MKTLNSKWIALLAAALICLGLSGAALAGYVKVSGVMPEFGSVSLFELSPDGRYAVYTADQELDGAFNIYSVLLPDGSPVRLGSALPAGSGVVSFEISQDSQRAVYLAGSPSGLDLYAAPLAGPQGSAVRLTNESLPSDQILTYSLSPDGQWVVFLAKLDPSAGFELFSVPVQGPASAALKISPPTLTSGGNVIDYLISPDSSRVVFRADAEADNRFDLYSASISGQGGSLVMLNGEVLGEGVQWGFKISPDSSRVVYKAAVENRDACVELFSVPLAGPASSGVRLNLPLQLSQYHSDRVLSVEVSHDSQYAVYLMMVLNWEGFYEYELFSVPLDGPWEESIRLFTPIGSKKGVMQGYQITPDSSRVVFYVNTVTNMPEPSLYSSPIRGPETEAVRLNLIKYPEGWVGGMRISPDSQTVVYKIHNWFYGGSEWLAPELYSVSVTGTYSDSIRLTQPFAAGGELKDFEISPDGSRVVYLGEQLTAGVAELFSVPLQGPVGSAVKINPTLVEGGQVRGFAILPDSSRILYLADQEAAGRRELYLADDGLTLVRFTASAAVFPASSGKILLPVELSQAAALPVQVTYEVTGGTLDGEHYTLPPGPLVIPSGATTAHLELTLSPGLVLKNDETLEISLISALNAGVGEPARMTVTITPDGPVLPFFMDIFLPLVSRQQ